MSMPTLKAILDNQSYLPKCVLCFACEAFYKYNMVYTASDSGIVSLTQVVWTQVLRPDI